MARASSAQITTWTLAHCADGGVQSWSGTSWLRDTGQQHTWWWGTWEVCEFPSLFTQLIPRDARGAKGSGPRTGKATCSSDSSFGSILQQTVLGSHAELVACCCQDPSPNGQLGLAGRRLSDSLYFQERLRMWPASAVPTAYSARPQSAVPCITSPWGNLWPFEVVHRHERRWLTPLQWRYLRGHWRWCLCF